MDPTDNSVLLCPLGSKFGRSPRRIWWHRRVYDWNHGGLTLKTNYPTINNICWQPGVRSSYSIGREECPCCGRTTVNKACISFVQLLDLISIGYNLGEWHMHTISNDPAIAIVIHIPYIQSDWTAECGKKGEVVCRLDNLWQARKHHVPSQSMALPRPSALIILRSNVQCPTPLVQCCHMQ